MSYEHKEFTFSVLHSVYLSNFIIRNSCQNKVSKNHFLLKWSTDDCNLRSLLYLFFFFLLYLTTSFPFLFIFYDSLLQTSLTLYNSQAPTLSCFNNEEFSWGLESILLLRIACLLYFSISEYKLSIKLILNSYFKRQYFLSWQSGGAKKSCKIFPLIVNSNIYTSGHYFWWKLTARTMLGMYALVPSLSFAMPVMSLPGRAFPIITLREVTIWPELPEHSLLITNAASSTHRTSNAGICIHWLVHTFRLGPWYSIPGL